MHKLIIFNNAPKLQLNIFISRNKPKQSEVKDQASKDLIADLSLKMYLKITYNTVWLNYELIISKHLLKTLLIHHASKLCGEIKRLWTAVCLKS